MALWAGFGFSPRVNVLMVNKSLSDKDWPLWMFWCHSWRYEMFWVNFHFEYTYIKKDGWLFLVTLASLGHWSYKSTFLFHNAIRKLCKHEKLAIRTGGVTPAYSKKFILKVSIRLSLQCLPFYLPSFLPWHGKFGKMLLNAPLRSGHFVSTLPK